MKARIFATLSTPAAVRCLPLPVRSVEPRELTAMPIFEGLYCVENAFTPKEAAERAADRREIAARRNR